ncbi:MAG: hypothetical protein HY904_14895, partial [Deltaproteobacteria bacterium]|nr:hypothetical protein [Deltaproteobacteria bacterium]
MSVSTAVQVTPALTTVLELLRGNRLALVDGCVARILETLPKYSLLDPSRLRASAEGFVDEVLAVDSQQGGGLMTRIIKVSQDRVAQGFSLSDYLRALLVFLPVARGVMRAGGSDQAPVLAQGFTELEGYVHGWAAAAADVWSESAARSLEAKNAELNRLNQRLVAHDRALSSEVAEVNRALAGANEFNRRVIDSLTSGLLVVEGPPHRRVSMYTNRLEQIAGKPAEEVLGRPVAEA